VTRASSRGRAAFSKFAFVEVQPGRLEEQIQALLREELVAGELLLQLPDPPVARPLVAVAEVFQRAGVSDGRDVSADRPEATVVVVG
jgi:hypothetical protein